MTRKPSLFNKKITCLHCQSRFKAKKERGKAKYICSKYDNKGECIRIPIHEDFLIELIEKRLRIPINREVVDEYVEQIIIEDFNLLEIFIKDQESILLSRTHLRF